jgi:hypothetical protein
MFTQVVGTVFDLMERHHAVWARAPQSTAVPTFGFRYSVGVEPVQVNTDRMVGLFRQGVSDLMPLWERVLSAETCGELRALASPGPAAFRFPAPLWVRVVYEAAAAYHRRALPPEHLLKAMIPLYLGRTAGFVLQTLASDGDEVEQEIERLGELFETSRPYLLDRWNTRPS